MKQKTFFGTVGRILSVALLMTVAGTATAEYPEKPIHIVVPWKAGGGTDAIGRAFAEGLSQVSGESTVVDNIAGASGATGTARAARSDADGYTLILNGSSDMTSTLTFRSQPYAIDDFVYIGGVYESPTWLLSHSDRGYETFQDFVDAVEERPGELKVGVGGTQNAHTLMAAAIRGMADLDYRIINYGGGADLRRALLANEVDAGVIHAPVLLGEAREGLINVLATGGPLDRINHEPLHDTPTLRELGIPASFGVTRAVMAPKGLPENVRRKLEAYAEEAVATEHYREFGANFGFAPVWIPGDEMEAHIRGELEAFRDIKETHLD